MSKAIKNEEDEPDNRSPAQIIPRYIDTSLKFNGYPVKKYVVGFVPGILCALVGLLTVAMGAPLWIPLAFIVLLTPAALVSGALMVIKSDWHTPPRERFRNWRRAVKFRWSMPWNYSETIAQNLAGVEDIYTDGTARMVDGRVVGLAEMRGLSTDRMDDETKNESVNQFGGSIDENIKDFGFRFYTTTLHTSDTKKLTQPFRQAARSDRFQGGAWNYVRSVCRQLAEWRDTIDTPAWDTPDRHHYIVVSATVDDARSLPSPTLLDRVSPFRTTQDVTERQERRAAKHALKGRLSKVEDAVNAVDGLSADAISPDEHAQLLLNYWTGEKHTPDEEHELAFQREHTGPTVWPHARTQETPDGTGPVPAEEREEISDSESSRAPGNRTARERLFGLFDSASDGDEASNTDGVTGLSPDDETPTQRLLAPGIYDVTNDYVRVGDQLCRTYWISQWPTEPDSMFWRPIYTLFGAELDGGDLDPQTDIPLDIDVSIHVEPEDRDTVMNELKKQWGSIGAESMQRSEEGGDVTALGVDADQDAYTQMYELLRTTNVQPWRVSAYVTIRAGRKQAIEQFEDTLRDYADLDAAKLDALRVRSDQITDKLEAAPTNCTPVMAGNLHHSAFEAGSPTGKNAFANIGRRDLKTQWMLGDAVAALFPPCADSIQEEGGIEWGRNEQDGQVLKADPTKRGLAPHIITIGTSRSGKSYSAQKSCMRWYTEKDDRTLIVLDTQGEFDGITKALNGKHIVLGGSDAVNPFHTEAPPDHSAHTGGEMNPFTMKANSIVQFIKAIISTGGRDPAPFHNTIEQLVRRTLIDAGADPNDPSSLADADATMRDFIEMTGEAMEEPSILTLGTHEKEIDNKEDIIAALRDSLGSFKEGQTYEYLLDEDSTGLMDDDVDMAYLDLRQFRDSGAAEKSAMFRLMLDQVNQKVKRTEGETTFLIDEAHFLLHSEEMVNWLQKAAREWARYNATLWFASQSPREFITQTTGGGGENKRRTIYDQCSTVQFFRTSDVDDAEEEILSKFGLNDDQIDHVRKRATPGWAGEGYTQALVQFDDRPESWFPVHIEASPVEDAICDYSPREHGDFGAYMEAKCGIEPTDKSDYTPPASAVPVVPSSAAVDDESSPAATTAPSPKASADGGLVADIASDDTDSETYDGSDWADDYHLAARGESAPNDEDTPTSDRESESEQEQQSEADRNREEKKEEEHQEDEEQEKQEDTPTDDHDEKPRATVEFTPGNEDTADTNEDESQSRSNGEIDQPTLTDIQQVADERADDLREAGYESVGEIAAADQSALAEVEGIGGARAGTMVESANDLLNDQDETF